MADFIYYTVGDKRAKVTKDAQEEFEKKYPDAKVHYTYNGRNAQVSLGARDNFLSKYGADNITYSAYDDNKQYSPELSTEKVTYFEKPSGEEEDDKTSLGETFLKGTGAGLVRAGKAALDLGNLAFKNSVIGKPIDWARRKFGDHGDVDEELRDNSNPITRASMKLGEVADKLSREADPTGGEIGFVDLISDGKYGMALQKALGSGLESLPMMVAAASGPGALIYGAGMAASTYSDETRENPDIPSWKRGVNALGSAALEMSVERLGGPLKNIFKKAGGEVTEEAAAQILKNMANEGKETIAKRIFDGLKKIGKEGIEEGGEEVITSFGNDALGTALDLIDGDKDYGFTAQWEREKEANPDADMKEFALSKTKEYLDAFLGGALSGMEISGTVQGINAATAPKNDMERRYELGTKLSYRDMYDTDEVVKESVDVASKSFVNNDGETTVSSEFLSNLSAEDAYNLSRSEELSNEQRIALRNLAGAKAMQNGLTASLDAKLEEEIADARTKIEKASNADGSVVIGMLGDRAVYVKGAVANNGTVTLPNGSDGPVIIVDPKTGEETTVNSKDISSAISDNAASLFSIIEEGRRLREQNNRNTARSTVSIRARYKAIEPLVGKKIMINKDNRIIEVAVDRILPESGEVMIKGKKGDLDGESIAKVKIWDFYDSISRDDAGNPMFVEGETETESESITEETASETTTEETPQEAEVTEEDDFRDTVAPILINGTPVNVEVVSQDDKTNRVVYRYTDENGQRKTGTSTIGEFKSALQQAQEYKPEEPIVPEVPTTEEVTTEAPTGETTVEPTPVPTEVPAEITPTAEEINWDALFEQDPWAYLTELKNQFGDNAIDFINNEIAATEEEIAKLEKHRGGDRSERVKNLQKVAKLRLDLGTLYEMLNSFKPTSTADTTTEAPVEQTTETATETPVEQVAETEESTTIEPISEPIAEAPTEEAETPEVTAEPTETESTTETAEAPVEEEVTPTTEETPVQNEPIEEAPAAETEQAATGPQTEEAVEQAPVAPNPVKNPIREAQKREKSLATQLKRVGIPPEQKQDMAFNAGKDVGDFFATREEYDAYAENATDLGDYNADFERGVEESFAKRTEPQDVVEMETPQESSVEQNVQTEQKTNDQKTSTMGQRVAIGRIVDSVRPKIAKLASKVSLKDFVATDDIRPAMTGIYHKDGYEYASDAMVLAKIKSEYPSELEGKIISAKTGKQIDVRYPNADDVIRGAVDSKAGEIDISIDDIIANAQAIEDIKKGMLKGATLYVRVGQDMFNSSKLLTAAKMAKQQGLTKVLQQKDIRNRAMAFVGDNGAVLVMPMTKNTDFNVLDTSNGDVTFDSSALSALKTPSTLKGIETAREILEALLPNLNRQTIELLIDSEEIKLVDGKVVYTFPKSDIIKVKEKAKDPNTYNALEDIEKNGLIIPMSEEDIASVFAESTDDDIRYRRGDDNSVPALSYLFPIDNINEQFNEELQRQIDGTLPEGHIYYLGMPSDILRSTGIPMLPIQLSSTRLKEKSNHPRHSFELSEIKDLVKAISQPIGVFVYGDKGKSQNIVVEIQHDGKNFIVGLFVSPTVGGNVLNVNSIRNVFPKDNAEWLNWISQNKALYLDKEKIQTLINQQRMNLADVDYLDLDSIANIVENFENPSTDEDYLDAIDKTFRQNTAIDNLVGEAKHRTIQRVVDEEAKKLGINVTFKTREEMPKANKNDKGYFNTRTGEIVVCTDNNASINDAIQTILHEAVAHKGLRQLMGDRFDEFINRVYESLDDETKAKVDKLANDTYEGNTAVAMEEYMASLAEKEDFAKTSIWEKIKDIFNDIINKILNRGDIKIGDNELRYILRASYANMVNPRNMETIEGWAQDQMMREEHKINEATPEILSRTGIDPTESASETARQVYNRVVQDGWQEFERQFQDDKQPVRIAIDAIQQETGNVPIEDYENYILINNQASSRSRIEIDNFARKYYSPIIDKTNRIIDRILEKRGFDIEDKAKRAEVYAEIRQYLIAKHGLERNAYYQAKNTKTVDGEDVPDLRDYSGLTALFGMEPKQYKEAEAEAQRLVDSFEADMGDMTAELWKSINKATNKTLKHSYECGMISRQQYNEIKGMFQYYIPLRGFDETTAEDVYAYARFEGNRFNPAVAKTKGRTSLADDPIAIIMNMAESEIAQGNKNRAKQALYNYLLNRPITDKDGNQRQNTLMQIEDVWYVKNGDGTYSIAAPNHEIGETYEEFEDRMQALAKSKMAKKSKKGHVDLGMRFQKKMNENAHYIYLKINGVEKAIYVNGDPKAAEAVNGSYKSKPQFGESKMRTINRFLSSTFTNYSLEFTARNYFRDMLYSHINIGIKEKDPAYRKKFRQNWRHNNLPTMMKMIKAYRAGEYEGRPLTEDEAAFVEFMENGGQTGYTLINSVENHKKDLERAIKNMQNGIEKGGIKDSTAFKYTLGAIETLNEASELVTRFAAFKTSRDMGRGVETSINDAKEVTVNFNTKGAQDGRGWMGFIAQYFGWSKFFFNASVQGVQNITAMAKANKLKFCAAASGIIATGFFMPLITAGISMLFGGDDEEEYWNIPEYERQNNLCIVVGNSYVKIPLPVGFRELYAVGDMVAAMAFDKKFTRDFMQVGTDIANKFASVILPINPLESSANGLSIWHTGLYTALPSSLQFAIQNATNIDWKGAPLQKEYTYNETDPQWMKAYASNPDWMVTLSKWCNEHINPDGDYDGWDWSPEKLDNTLSNLLGGVYSLIKKSGRSIQMIWNEETRNLSNIPLAGVVTGSGLGKDDRFVNDAYYDMKEYYDENIGKIERTAKAFGLSLKDVFEGDKMGAHHPKMQQIYSNRNFDWMQEWYLGDKELKSIRDKIKRREKKVNASENPSRELLDEIAALNDAYDVERRDFVDDMLKLDD